MPRPRKCRNVNTTPEVTYFKPRGVPLRELAEIYLPLDGFEAIRLADLEGLNHEAAAQQMHVSRQTFGRILASAHQTVAKALVSGMALRIHGGDYRLAQSVSEEDEAEDFTESSIYNPTDNLDDQHESRAGAFGEQVGAERHAQKDQQKQHQEHQFVQKESTSMKRIAVTSEGPTLDDRVDPRFGRAAGFVIVNPETMEFEYLDNGASQARAQGAGIQAAENVVSTGVEAVLTGYVGPKAFQALAATGIRVAQNLENMSVREAVEHYLKGDLSWADADQARGLGK